MSAALAPNTCPILGGFCEEHCTGRCPHCLVPLIGALHFVGFRHPAVATDPRYDAAVRAFGAPDVIHRHWDERARAEITEHDVVVFAQGDEFAPASRHSFDDSNEH